MQIKLNIRPYHGYVSMGHFGGSGELQQPLDGVPEGAARQQAHQAYHQLHPRRADLSALL